jgi:chitodextrinase
MDTVAPTAPTNLTTSNYGANSFTLSWSAATDNLGIANYEVFRNGASCGVTSATSLVITGLDLTTLYNMTVRARDVGGNVSAPSATKPVWLDLTAPTQPGTPSLSIPYRVVWTASTDNSSVTAYEVLRNGVLLATVTTPWADLPSLIGLDSQITVRARDTAGNWSALSSALAISTQTATASMGLAGANSGPNYVTLTWKAASDGLTAASYNIYEGTVMKGSTRELTYIDLAPSTTGNLTYKVRAVNAAGVESTAEATATVTVPTTYSDDADHDGIPGSVEDLLGTGTTPTDIASRDTTNALQVKLHRPN